jgi:laminin alpha 1/2
MEGFYGNARMGTINDCKRCKCPLEVASNNFSPTCRVATIDYDKYSVAPEQYICNACPKGYAGPHCERYFDAVVKNSSKIFLPP